MTAWNRIQRTQDPRVDVAKLITLSDLKKTIILMLDGKHFRIHRKVYTLYVGLDGVTSKPLAWTLLPGYELKDGYDVILRHLKSKKYRIKAVISDWHIGLMFSVSEYYPRAIHQRCAAHVLMEAFRKLGGKRFLMTGLGGEIWPVMKRIALGFKHQKYARMYLGKMEKKHPRYVRAFRILKKSLSDIYQFEKRPELNIPRTSNKIENFMGVLEQRLKIFRGTKTPKTTIKIFIYSHILENMRIRE